MHLISFCLIRLLPPLLGLLTLGTARADTLQVAVASNFAAPMQQIAADFEQRTGHKLALTLGATGKFYAQIRNGAPFQLLLAADAETPARLVQDGLAQDALRRPYAIGRLVLWSARPGLVDPQGAMLRRLGQPDDPQRLRHLALANPKVAPYGAAALQVLERLGLARQVQPLLVQGENIAQTHQFVATGNAELGFVALSQVQRDGQLLSGSAWVVPAELHAPIRQDAVVLGAGSPAARALLEHLASPAARQVIRRHGYDLP